MCDILQPDKLLHFQQHSMQPITTFGNLLQPQNSYFPFLIIVMPTAQIFNSGVRNFPSLRKMVFD